MVKKLGLSNSLNRMCADLHSGAKLHSVLPDCRNIQSWIPKCPQPGEAVLFWKAKKLGRKKALKVILSPTKSFGLWCLGLGVLKVE